MSWVRDRLLGLLKEHSYQRGSFVLSSGRTSDYMIDVSRVSLTAEGALAFGIELRAMVNEMDETPVAAAGVAMGGCPLVSATAYSWALDAIYVMHARDPAERYLQGASRLPEGSKVVVVEDVVTTGASVLGAIEELKKSRFDVIGVLAVVDRLEGGRQNINPAGRMRFRSMFTRDDFL